MLIGIWQIALDLPVEVTECHVFCLAEQLYTTVTQWAADSDSHVVSTRFSIRIVPESESV